MSRQSHRHSCTCERCESPHRRYTAVLWLAVFLLGLAHGWLHLASNDQDGHFAHNDGQCCLVQSLGGGTAPPILEVSLPDFVPVSFVVTASHEIDGLPSSIGYSPRDPPIA
ncbi:MAG: hypothetical protein WAN51_13290 [Alphaproteobacteria bacterium]